jgi:Glycosyl hydrolases family 16
MIRKLGTAMVAGAVAATMFGVTACATPGPRSARQQPRVTAQPAGPGGHWTITHDEGSRALASWPQTLTGAGRACGRGTRGTVSESGGDLRLTVSGAAGNCAQITSPFLLRYGFIQARMFIPASVDADRLAWPAFWMVPPQRVMAWPWGGEIDTYEQLHAQSACQTFHYEGPAGPATAGGSKCEVIKPGWHVFGVWWQPHELRFYLDGNLVRTLRAFAIAGVPMNVLVENKVASRTTGSTVRVLYVRTWEQA